MKIKLDENLPFRLVTPLKDLGHDTHTVHGERLVGHADRQIWEAAQKESRFFHYNKIWISQTRVALPLVRITGILLIRLRSPNRRNLFARINELFSKRKRPPNGRDVFVVATERKIRVLKA